MGTNEEKPISELKVGKSGELSGGGCGSGDSRGRPLFCFIFPMSDFAITGRRSSSFYLIKYLLTGIFIKLLSKTYNTFAHYVRKF